MGQVLNLRRARSPGLSAITSLCKNVAARSHQPCQLWQGKAPLDLSRGIDVKRRSGQHPAITGGAGFAGFEPVMARDTLRSSLYSSSITWTIPRHVPRRVTGGLENESKTVDDLAGL